MNKKRKEVRKLLTMRGFPELAESNFEIMNFPLKGTEQTR